MYGACIKPSIGAPNIYLDLNFLSSRHVFWSLTQCTKFMPIFVQEVWRYIWCRSFHWVFEVRCSYSTWHSWLVSRQNRAFYKYKVVADLICYIFLIVPFPFFLNYSFYLINPSQMRLAFYVMCMPYDCFPWFIVFSVSSDLLQKACTCLTYFSWLLF